MPMHALRVKLDPVQQVPGAWSTTRTSCQTDDLSPYIEVPENVWSAACPSGWGRKFPSCQRGRLDIRWKGFTKHPRMRSSVLVPERPTNGFNFASGCYIEPSSPLPVSARPVQWVNLPKTREENHYGKPTSRTRALKRGSDRSGSMNGSQSKYAICGSRSSWARRSHAKAWFLSARAP